MIRIAKVRWILMKQQKHQQRWLRRKWMIHLTKWTTYWLVKSYKSIWVSMDTSLVPFHTHLGLFDWLDQLIFCLNRWTELAVRRPWTRNWLKLGTHMKTELSVGELLIQRSTKLLLLSSTKRSLSQLSIDLMVVVKGASSWADYFFVCWSCCSQFGAVRIMDWLGPEKGIVLECTE